MILMDLKFLLVFQLLFFSAATCENQKNFVNGTRFQSINCQANNSTLIINYCFIKAISRKVTTINIGLSFLKPVNKPIYVLFSLNYRYGLIYREVINTKKQEWCEIMEGKSTHLYITQTINQIKETAPHLIHKCPYEGGMEIKNLTLDENKSLDVFSEGFYKLVLLVFDKSDDPIFKLNLTVQVKSSIKESMG